MTDTQLLEQIQKSIKSTIESVFNEMGIKDKIKPMSEQNTFKKTEQVLWNYAIFNKLIDDKLAQIEEVKAHGVRTKSKSITEYQNTGGFTTGGLETEEETIQMVVDNLEKELSWLRSVLQKIDFALDVVRNSEHYDVLKAYYFDGVMRDQLALEYNVDVKTISRWKNALVREIALHLFPEEVVTEMMNQ